MGSEIQAQSDTVVVVVGAGAGAALRVTQSVHGVEGGGSAGLLCRTNDFFTFSPRLKESANEKRAARGS